MYLLDTCVLSDSRRQSLVVLEWLASKDPEALFISPITLGDIARGVDLKARSDPRGVRPLAVWLDSIRLEYAERVLPVDQEIGLAWGRLTAVRPRPFADALIAATALIHTKAVVTRDAGAFADMGVPIINPWAL